MSRQGISGRRSMPCSQAGLRPKRLGREIVEFSVRGPVAVGLDEEHKVTPGCSVIDLLFPSPSQIGDIVFRNYYTARVTLLVRFAGALNANIASGKLPEESSSWSMAVRQRVLMPYPHYETGSQDLFSITVTESAVEWNNLVAVRLILRQPSPVWRTFHVEELNVYRDLPRRVPRPVQQTQSTASAHHCQGSFLVMIQQNTMSALRINSPSPEENTSKECHIHPGGYEFTSLPQP